MHDHGELAVGVIETTRTRGPRGKAHCLKCASVRIFPYGTRIAGAIHAAHLLRHEVGRQSELLRKRHVQWAFGHSVKVSFSNIDKAHSEWFAVPGALASHLGEQQFLCFKGRCRRKECVVLVTLVDLTCDQPATNVWVGRISLVAVDPAGANENVVWHLEHVFFQFNLPDPIVEIVQLLHDRRLGQQGIEHFTCVLVHVPRTELLGVVCNRKHTSGHLLDRRDLHLRIVMGLGNRTGGIRDSLDEL